MRLRAEYLLSQRRYGEIVLFDNNYKAYTITENADRSTIEKYLELVFARCGTALLEKQLKPVKDLKGISLTSSWQKITDFGCWFCHT